MIGTKVFWKVEYGGHGLVLTRWFRTKQDAMAFFVERVGSTYPRHVTFKNEDRIAKIEYLIRLNELEVEQ